MNIHDIHVGQRVVIGGKYLDLGTPDDPLGPLFGVTATVIAVSDRPGSDVYPHGMVAVELPERTAWPVRTVQIGPEDLAPVLGQHTG